MSPVVTMVEARVEAARRDELIAAFPAKTPADLPPWLLGTMLISDPATDRWRIVTSWRSRSDLDEYRRSVEVPAAVQAFRSVGAEPLVEIWQAAILLRSAIDQR